jgi:nucleoside-diphosphate-sugar epimerase
MPVVVTGSAGFIGRHLVRALARRGHEVVGVDRRGGTPPEAVELLTDLAAPDAAARAALASAEAVWHLAAIPGVRGSGREIDRRRRSINVDAAAMLMGHVPLDVPLVVTSSSSVYGGVPAAGLRPFREDDPLAPRGGYARSKAALEGLCARRAEAGGRVAIARPFCVAGPGQRPDMAIARWLSAAAAGESLRLFGSPDRVRDVTDVADVVEGLVRMVEREVDGAVNLGSGQPRRIVDVAGTAAEVVGRRPSFVLEPGSMDEVDATLADTTRARALLGIEPNLDLEDVVSRQAADLGLVERPRSPRRAVA